MDSSKKLRKTAITVKPVKIQSQSESKMTEEDKEFIVCSWCDWCGGHVWQICNDGTDWFIRCVECRIPLKGIPKAWLKYGAQKRKEMLEKAKQSRKIR